MAFLTQNMNQFKQAPILGGVDEIPTPDVVSAQINPSSVATAIQVGSLVKLVAGASGAIVVDVVTGPTDGPVFGCIPFNQRKNIYSPGNYVEVACGGAYMYMKSSAAIARGDTVSGTAATTTADPTVATDTTSGHFACGIAVDIATGANQLIRVKIAASKLP